MMRKRIGSYKSENLLKKCRERVPCRYSLPPLIWVLLLAVALAAWLLLDTPSGPSEIIDGRIIGSSISFKGNIVVTIRTSDGNEITRSSIGMPSLGTAVTCLRRKRRLSGVYDYQCL
jgi:hypothetical protein